MNKKKKIIVLVLVLLCTIFLGLSYKSLSNGIPLDSVKLSKEDRKRFAIKIEDSNGDYIDYNGDTWPGVGYILNIEESKCTTKNGEVINNILEYSNYVVKVTTKKSVFCYLYFDQGYVVAFNTNGGSSIESITVPKSGTAVVSRPENPTKSGKGLVRWEQSTCSEYAFSPPITGNITLNAVWGDANNVTFSTNGGTSIASQIVGDGGTVVRPANPTKSGYTFEKWIANGREYDFNREVKKNLN